MTQKHTAHRRPRDREATEARLLEAARRLLEREGVLAGVTLSKVADEAGVNRGQIYQYFGTRRQLLRAALASMSRQRAAEADFERPFRARRQAVFDKAIERNAEIRLDALLALDGDTDLGLFPVYDQAIEALERDVETGALPADADVEMLHVLTASTYLGYAVFREAMSAETGVPLTEMDDRARATFVRILDSVAAPDAPDASGTDGPSTRG